jgi:hypothetical protein
MATGDVPREMAYVRIERPGGPEVLCRTGCPCRSRTRARC